MAAASIGAPPGVGQRLVLVGDMAARFVRISVYTLDLDE